MLSILINRSNGKCYFVVAKLLILSDQGTAGLSGYCKYSDGNGLESLCRKRWDEWCALLLLSVLRIAPGEKDQNVTEECE